MSAATKINRRKGHRAFVTKTTNTIHDLLTAGEVDYNKLNGLRQSLFDKLGILSGLDDEILESIEGENEIATEIDEASGIRAKMQEVIFKVEDKLQEMKDTGRREFMENRSFMNYSKVNNAKLPKLSIKPFTGNPIEFQSFWDSFDASVNSNETLEEITKFTYLKSFLKGQSLSAIQGLSLTSENYKEAVKILSDRYGNKQLLITSHMDKLMNIKPVASTRDLTKIREVYDLIEVHVRNLSSLEIETSQYGPVLVSIVMSKLPNEIKLHISRSMPLNEGWDVDTLLQNLKQEIESREMCSRMSACNTNNPSTSEESIDYLPDEQFTGSTLYSGGRKDDISCRYFRRGHPSSKCKVITDVKARKAILRNKAKCFVCLKSSHIARQCKSGMKCFKCGNRHHISICETTGNFRNSNFNENQRTDNFRNSNLNANQRTDNFRHSNFNENKRDDNFRHSNFNENQSGDKQNFSGVTAGVRDNTLLQTARSIVSSGRIEMNVRILFDSCSQYSFINEDIYQKLRLVTVRSEKLIIKAFESKSQTARLMKVVKVKLKGWNNNWNEIELYVVPQICSPLAGQTIEIAQATHEHLIGLQLADSTESCATLNVDILVGGNYYWQFFSGKIVRGTAGPVAMETSLGWVLSGSVQDTPGSSTYFIGSSHVMKLSCDMGNSACHDAYIVNKISEFWDVENIGLCNNDDLVMKEFNDSIYFDGSNYSVRLPWKCDPSVLPDNFSLCKSRLDALIRRLSKNPNKLKMYDEIIKEQERLGVIEGVNRNDQSNCTIAHYLPHRDVEKEGRTTTKTRIVYDASARRHNNPSLNDCLQTGPCQLPKVFDILVRFRGWKFALTSDIKSAFLNIRINESDRDYLRFLWIDEIERENPSLVIKRFTSVPFGLKCSPFLLGGTIIHHMKNNENINHEFVDQFLRDLYMDDNITGFHDINIGFNYYSFVKTVMIEAGFILRKWKSNCKELLEKINEYEKQYFQEEIVDTGVNKILGVNWETESDTLIFDLNEIMKEAKEVEVVTKRFVLKIVSSIFDPLGILSPAVINLKIHFQEVCLMKIDWDVPLSAEFIIKWRSSLDLLSTLAPVHIKRHYICGNELKNCLNIELHGFSDASMKACATVVYLRAVLNCKILCTIVAAKTKVVPIEKKTLTIPKLELMACLLLSRLLKSVINSLHAVYEISDVICWTDANDCVHWINNVEKIRKKFVQSKIEEIRKNVPGTKWRHCPGTLNPADMHSRGLCKDNDMNVWIHGPVFLSQSRDQWPVTPVKEDNDREEKDESCIINIVDIKLLEKVNNSKSLGDCDMKKLFNIQRYSSMQKLLRVTCYVIRFIQQLKKKTKLISNKEIFPDELQGSELENVKMLWIKNEQKMILINPKRVKDLEYSLGLFIDDHGILRLRGRVQNIDGDFETKFPIFLDKDSYFTDLIILDCHERVKHSRVKDTLNQLRSSYWITQGRRTVKRGLKKCTLCRKFDSKAFNVLPAAPLPSFRLKVDFPFTSTGIDYFGPLFVKNIFNPDNELYKVHVVLYTCASSRAIHLDLVPDLSCYAFVKSLKRFINRYGLSRLYISDNATCFTGPALTSFIQSVESEWKYFRSKPLVGRTLGKTCAKL